MMCRILRIITHQLFPHEIPNNPTNPKIKPTEFSKNTIPKNKKPNQSQFRVHFTLMNIKWKLKQPQKQQKLIDHLMNVMNDHCRVSIAQIIADIDDNTFDVSVGLSNDIEAYQFLTKKLMVKLSDGGGMDQHQYRPFVSRVFQSFINKMQKTRQILPENHLQLGRADSMTSLHRAQSRQNFNIMQQQPNITPQPKYGEVEQNPKSLQNLPKLKQKKSEISDNKYKQKEGETVVNRIWAFGIPKQYNIPEIKQSIKKYGLDPGECKWKNKQHMQYLDIELTTPISKSRVYYLGLQIQQYPYIVIPQVGETEIPRELARYTVEIVIRPTSEDEEKFIKCMSQIGGVNVMIRTPVKEKDDFRYLVVFNSVDSAQKACRAAKDIRECTAQRKQYELRIGRLNKFYSFTDLVREIYPNKH